MTFDIGLHEVCVRTGVRYVITKFSGMDSLPNFLTHGAPLRARLARAGAPLLVILFLKNYHDIIEKYKYETWTTQITFYRWMLVTLSQTLHFTYKSNHRRWKLLSITNLQNTLLQVKNNFLRPVGYSNIKTNWQARNPRVSFIKATTEGTQQKLVGSQMHILDRANLKPHSQRSLNMFKSCLIKHGLNFFSS